MSETIEYKGHIIIIERDDDCESPRTWDNLGTLVCFHKRYDFGDKGHHYSFPEELMAHIKESESVWLPVFLFDHSSLRMSCQDFNDRWDSGQIGAIFVTREKIIKEYGDDSAKNRAIALKCLKGEIETMNQYLSGEVYWYSIKKNPSASDTGSLFEEEEAEEIDSCSGFFGIDHCRTEAKSSVDSIVGTK